MFRMTWFQRAFSIGLALSLAAMLASSACAAEQLSQDQLVALQREAEAAFDRGVQQQASDPVNSKDDFALAAQKYQLLVDARTDSGPLRFNLANSQLHSGQVGAAIANYLQAEKLMPGDNRVAAGLQAARTLVGTPPTTAAQGLATKLLQWNEAFSLNTRAWTAIAAWIALWVFAGLAMFWPSRRWRMVWVPALAVAIVAGASVGYQRFALQGPEHGVVTAAKATVRQGNGEGFSPQFADPLTAGTEFAVADRRGDWIKIELADGRSGWVNDHDAAVIE